jgi:hypothetical protein
MKKIKDKSEECNCMQIICDICEPKIDKLIMEAAERRAKMQNNIELHADEYVISMMGIDKYNDQYYENYVKNIKAHFIDGVISEAGRIYNSKNTYSEEEVKQLLNQVNCLTVVDFNFDWKEWFEINKK